MLWMFLLLVWYKATKTCMWPYRATGSRPQASWSGGDIFFLHHIYVMMWTTSHHAHFPKGCWWDANMQEIKFVHWRTSLLLSAQRTPDWNTVRCSLIPSECGSVCYQPSVEFLLPPPPGSCVVRVSVTGRANPEFEAVAVNHQHWSSSRPLLSLTQWCQWTSALFSWDFKITTFSFHKLSRMGWIRDKMIVLLCTWSLQDFSRKCGSFTAQF